MVPFYNFKVVNGENSLLFPEQICNIMDIAGNMVYLLLIIDCFKNIKYSFRESFADEFGNMPPGFNISWQVPDDVAEQFLDAVIPGNRLSKKEGGMDHE